MTIKTLSFHGRDGRGMDEASSMENNGNNGRKTPHGRDGREKRKSHTKKNY